MDRPQRQTLDKPSKRLVMLTYDCPGCGGWHYHPDSSILCKFLAAIGGHYTPTETDIEKFDVVLAKANSGVDKPAATD